MEGSTEGKSKESSPPKHVPAAATYRDFSQLTEAENASVAPLLQMRSERNSKAATTTYDNFPAKLHYVLGELESDGLSHLASWAPHGRSFSVHKPNEFVEEVLRRFVSIVRLDRATVNKSNSTSRFGLDRWYSSPDEISWFRQTKFASFQRQLNIYGFNRITVGADKGSYYHEYFLRGKPFLACNIQRVDIKGTGPRRASSFGIDTNFYQMPFLPPNQGQQQEDVKPAAVGTSNQLGAPSDLGTMGVTRHAAQWHAHEATPLERAYSFPDPLRYARLLAAARAAGHSAMNADQIVTSQSYGSLYPQPTTLLADTVLAMSRQRTVDHERALGVQSLAAGFRSTQSTESTSQAWLQQILHQYQTQNQSSGGQSQGYPPGFP